MNEPNYRCPVCRTSSGLIIGATQALCTNDTDCHVLIFNPSLPDGGLSQASNIDLGTLFGTTPKPPEES